ncbi:transporter [Pseudopedobacter beijingensis]|uniref:Transporter n=1 Tax=Pseudopedobacter beijingensis TaxID=1207056 RepID=A0ABW4IGE8_9SPHI
MNKKIILLLVFFAIQLGAKACDICGCGVGSYYLGILPEFNKKFVGLRYQHKQLQTHLGPGAERTPLTENETYQTAEVWGGWNIGNKFRVLAFLPYNFNRRESQEGVGQKNGLGDIALMGYYKMFDGKNTLNEKLLVQSLWVGAGIKVPTGKYNAADADVANNSPNNFQLGTASTDFTINAAYDIRLMDLGLNLNANYKMNTENKYHYRYGNKLSVNGLLYHKFKVGKMASISPNAGVLYETSAKDVENNKYDVDASGGYSTAGIVGFEAIRQRVSIGANYQHVFAQNLAEGRAKAGDRILVHLSYAF